MGSYTGHLSWFQVSLRSVEKCGSCGGSKFRPSHWLGTSLIQLLVATARAVIPAYVITSNENKCTLHYTSGFLYYAVTCGCLNKPNYGSRTSVCLFVRPSIRLSASPSRRDLLTRIQKAQTGVKFSQCPSNCCVPIFRSKGQKLVSGFYRCAAFVGRANPFFLGLVTSRITWRGRNHSSHFDR